MSNLQQSVLFAVVFLSGVYLGVLLGDSKDTKPTPEYIIARLCYKASPSAIMKDPVLMDWYRTFCTAEYVKW